MPFSGKRVLSWNVLSSEDFLIVFQSSVWWQLSRILTFVALGTALRRGELLALRWQDVQLLEARMNEENYPEELITMRETAARQTTDTGFRTFHVWHQEGSN